MSDELTKMLKKIVGIQDETKEAKPINKIWDKNYDMKLYKLPYKRYIEHSDKEKK